MFTKIQNWFKSIIVETKAITWPTRRRIINDSTVVVVSLVIGSAVLAGVDYLLLELFKAAINKVG